MKNAGNRTVPFSGTPGDKTLKLRQDIPANKQYRERERKSPQVHHTAKPWQILLLISAGTLLLEGSFLRVLRNVSTVPLELTGLTAALLTGGIAACVLCRMHGTPVLAQRILYRHPLIWAVVLTLLGTAALLQSRDDFAEIPHLHCVILMCAAMPVLLLEGCAGGRRGFWVSSAGLLVPLAFCLIFRFGPGLLLVLTSSLATLCAAIIRRWFEYHRCSYLFAVGIVLYLVGMLLLFTPEVRLRCFDTGLLFRDGAETLSSITENAGFITGSHIALPEWSVFRSAEELFASSGNVFLLTRILDTHGWLAVIIILIPTLILAMSLFVLTIRRHGISFYCLLTVSMLFIVPTVLYLLQNLTPLSICAVTEMPLLFSGWVGNIIYAVLLAVALFPPSDTPAEVWECMTKERQDSIVWKTKGELESWYTAAVRLPEDTDVIKAELRRYGSTDDARIDELLAHFTLPCTGLLMSFSGSYDSIAEKIEQLRLLNMHLGTYTILHWDPNLCSDDLQELFCVLEKAVENVPDDIWQGIFYVPTMRKGLFQVILLFSCRNDGRYYKETFSSGKA